MKVTPEQLKKLQDYQVAINHLTFCIGVAWVEFRENELKLIAEGGGMPEPSKMGSLYNEFNKGQAFFMQKLSQKRLEAESFGKVCLQAIGLDTDRRDFTINKKNGDVLELLHAKWHQLGEDGLPVEAH